MSAMHFNKPLIFMKPNNKGTKNLICRTALAKVVVARRQHRVENTVVDSRPRSWRSLTKRPSVVVLGVVRSIENGVSIEAFWFHRNFSLDGNFWFH